MPMPTPTLAACLAGIFAGGCAAPRAPSLTAITPDSRWTRTLMPIEGTEPGLRGGDGAASCPIPGGRTLWLFGDSWIGRVESGRYLPGAAMVNNVALVHDTPIPGEPVLAESLSPLWGPTPRPGVHSAFVVPAPTDPKRTTWCWPCDGAITIGPDSSPRLAIFYADLGRRVENPSPEDVWNFRFLGNRIAIIENPLDPPAHWRTAQHALEPRDPARMSNGAPGISWGIVAMRDPVSLGDRDPQLLIYGIDGSNPWDKLIMLARVRASSLTDFSTWKFWNGETWADTESNAKPVAHNGVDEFTIHRGRKHWIMIQGEPLLGHHILVRTAEALQGPWSDGRAIYTIPEPATDKNLITYGAKAHPHLSAPGELLISYCINSTDFFQAARDVEIYRPRFIRVPLSSTEAAVGGQ